MNAKTVSTSVINRLPRYYRFLGRLLRTGVARISSKELAHQMKVTASQIRQDLNCFGGFGQQGYGYNVEMLHNEIGQILGVENAAPSILIGAGSLGRSITGQHDLFTERGFTLVAAFDKSPDVIGTTLGNGLVVQPAKDLVKFCKEREPRMAVICIPRTEAEKMADTLVSLGIEAFWNFSGYDFTYSYDHVSAVNVHLGDSLLTLSYMFNHRKDDKEPG